MQGRHAMGLERAAAIALAAFVILAAPAAVRAGGDWNDKSIAWKSYEEGIAAAKKERKPVLLVFYTEWCPHCTNYSAVFRDEKVVDRAKKFVMVRIDKDKHPEVSKKYAPDGEYIPRTYFLTPAGELSSITAPRDKYKYFYDEHQPASLLAGMDKALSQLAN